MTTLFFHLAAVTVVCITIGEIVVYIEKRKPFKK